MTRTYRFKARVPDLATAEELREVVNFFSGYGAVECNLDTLTLYVSYEVEDDENAVQDAPSRDFAAGYLRAMAEAEVDRELASRGWEESSNWNSTEAWA